MSYGLKPYRKTDLTNTPVQINGENETKLFSLIAANINSSDAWIHFYDQTATPTVGTTTPVYSLFVPKGDGTNHGAAGFPIPGNDGLDFEYSCWIAATTTIGGGTAPTSDIKVNGLFR